MSLFDIIFQLSIISALGLMIQSAPINTMITKRSTLMCAEKNLTILENRLKFAARDLYHATGRLLNASNPSDFGFYVKTEIRHKFYSLSSPQCKNYTNVTILKHQLQDHIFNTDLTAEHDAGDISIILTSLQAMADIFNDYEFSIANKRCVELTPAQYQIMYNVNNNQTYSLLKLLRENFAGFYLDRQG